MENLSKHIKKETKEAIVRCKDRLEAAQIQKDISIHAAILHRPASIDESLFQNFDGSLKEAIRYIVSLDNPNTQTNNCIDIIVEMKSQDSALAEIVTRVIVKHLAKVHKLSCRKIIFVKPGTLEPFLRDSSRCKIARFILRDNIEQTEAMKKKIWFSSHPELPHYLKSNIEDIEEGDSCSECYNKGLPQPLDAESFNIVQEWFLEVPLYAQILLSNYINQHSLQKMSDSSKELYRLKQIECLYCTYDILLNTFNHQHFGLIQRIIT